MSQTVYDVISQTTFNSHPVDCVSSAFLLELVEFKNLDSGLCTINLYCGTIFHSF